MPLPESFWEDPPPPQRVIPDPAMSWEDIRRVAERFKQMAMECNIIIVTAVQHEPVKG